MTRTKSFLIAGFGSIGQRHSRNLLALNAGRVAIFDPDEPGFLNAQKHFRDRCYKDYDTALAAGPYDAVCVCAPSHLHLPLALKAAARGYSLFIEKPLSHSLEGLEILEREVDKKGIVAFVACNLRFHPGIAAMKKLLDENAIGKVLHARVEFGYWLPNWRPQADYRQSYSANREMGGGVILDAIHELDYISWFLGDMELKYAFADKISGLEIRTEDMAEMALVSTSGTFVSVQLDYLQKRYHRSCRLVGETGVIDWDFNARRVSCYDGRTKTLHTQETDSGYDLNTMYLDEMKHFLRCLEKREVPMQDLSHAKKVLKLALEAQSSFQVNPSLVSRDSL